MKPRYKFAIALMLAGAILGLAASLLLGWSQVSVAAAAAVETPALVAEAYSWGFLAAALATGLSALGAGFAVATVGAAAIGAIAEKPELLGRSLILVGLAEGIAIYGLIVSILILNRLV